MISTAATRATRPSIESCVAIDKRYIRAGENKSRHAFMKGKLQPRAIRARAPMVARLPATKDNRSGLHLRLPEGTARVMVTA